MGDSCCQSVDKHECFRMNICHNKKHTNNNNGTLFTLTIDEY